MAWPADQNNIYYSGYYSAPPLPELLDFSWELDLPVDSMRHWESYCLSCHRPMLASSPDPQSVVPGPNPTRSVPASGNVHSQTPQTSEYVKPMYIYIYLCYATYLSTNSCTVTRQVKVPPCNASGRVVASLSNRRMTLCATFGSAMLLPMLFAVLSKIVPMRLAGNTIYKSTWRIIIGIRWVAWWIYLALSCFLSSFGLSSLLLFFSFLFNGVFWNVVFSLRKKVFDSPEYEHCHP